MLRIEELPSLKGIASIILSEGGAGQLILFSLPTMEVWKKWQEYLLGSLRNRLSELGQEQFWDTMIADNDSSSPQRDIAEFLGLPATAAQKEILSVCGGEPPLIIELFCGGTIGPSWHQFIENTARFFRVYDSRNSNRVVCIFLIAPGVMPPVRTNAGLRCYAFWNPLRWEETRLIAADSVGVKDNVLSRAWQISTYAGAANTDPEVIARLSRNTPRSLSEVRQEILACRENGQYVTNNNGLEKRFFEEKRWDIPAGLVQKWLDGTLLGCTLDRGVIMPWEQIPDEYFDTLLCRTIWREQVAGLYPLLMEITFFISEIITRIKGSNWKSYLSLGKVGEAITEPGEIISVFRDNKLGFLPEKIYRLLQQLRLVRNKLAHLEPVDLKDVHQIWSLFEQVSKRDRQGAGTNR